MKRLLWSALSIFTAWSFTFFLCLHFTVLVGVSLPVALIDGGVAFFAVALVPMWIVVAFNLPRGPWSKGENWLDAIFAEFPQPKKAKAIFKVLWFYFIPFFGLAIMLPDSSAEWIHRLKGAGIPGIFIGFYGMGFLVSWANWKKTRRARAPAS